MPAILFYVGRLEQEAGEFEASLGYIPNVQASLSYIVMASKQTKMKKNVMSLQYVLNYRNHVKDCYRSVLGFPLL